MKIAFIGVGIMGGGMAANLLAAGRALSVFDIDATRVAPLADAGAVAAQSVTGAAGSADVVMLSLPNAAAVETVAAEALSAMPPGSVLIDLSTSPPSLARTLAEQAAERSIAFLDAPVSGGQRGARDGTLSVIVGGESAVFERVHPLFDDIGANVYHMGDVGSGQTTKLVNNMMAFTSMWSLVEGLALGTKAGVDPNLLRDVVSNSSGSTTVWRSGTAAILKDRLTPTFDLQLVKKDLQLALDLADELGVETPMARTSRELLDRFAALGFEAEEIYATIRHHEEALACAIRGRWEDR